MIENALGDWDVANIDYLFVENVGNLVCPASYDLGEQLRVVLLAVTEGEDKPLKYPTIFNSADLAVITKSDLADAVEFDRGAAYANIRDVRPGLPIIETSTRSGVGLDTWIAYLEQADASDRDADAHEGPNPHDGDPAPHPTQRDRFGSASGSDPHTLDPPRLGRNVVDA
jgi:hydrogenase nickel incorporation protein HypB